MKRNSRKICLLFTLLALAALGAILFICAQTFAW